MDTRFLVVGVLEIALDPGRYSAGGDLTPTAQQSIDRLSRWEQEWQRVAEVESMLAFERGATSSAMEGDVDSSRAAAFLDCSGLGGSDDGFWERFRLTFSATGPLSDETGRLAYPKWLKWESFLDGMDEAGAFDGRTFVPLTGEYSTDGIGYYTRILDRCDWVKALQKAQWQGLFGLPPGWSSDNLEGFMACPVGFALVQYVVFIMNKMRLNLPRAEAEMNLKSMSYTFDRIFHWRFDHLESSSWNISSFDIAVNLNYDDFAYYPRYADFARARPAQTPIMNSWRVDWSEHKSWQLSCACQAWLQQAARPENTIRVALVGEHGPSNLEHFAALQAAMEQSCAMQDNGAQINLPYAEAGNFFTYSWHLKSLPDGELLHSSLRITWDAFWGEHLTVSAGRDPSLSKPLWTIERAVWALGQYAIREPFLKAAQLVICSEPLWLCVLMHAALRSQRLLTRASAAGRAMCLLVDFEQVFGAEEVSKFWPHVQRFAAYALPRGALSAASRMTAEMLAFQAGVRAPYVPFLSLHVAATAPYAPTSADVLFFRSSLSGAVAFHRVLRLLEAAMQPEATSNVVFMTSSMNYAEIAAFRAVVMLPHIPNALSLADVYAMGMPLLIPDEPLIHKFVWPVDPLPLLDVAIDLQAPNRSNPPFSPLIFQADKWKLYRFRDEYRYWLQFTEWQVRPHLLRFSSARDLLHKAKLSQAEAFAVSAQIRHSQNKLKKEAMEYWQTAVVAALHVAF